jgi:hypothetical protein
MRIQHHSYRTRGTQPGVRIPQEVCHNLKGVCKKKTLGSIFDLGVMGRGYNSDLGVRRGKKKSFVGMRVPKG